MYAFLLQVGEAVPSSLVDLILAARTPAKVVLVILLVLSLISWAVTFAKWVEFRRVRRDGAVLDHALTSIRSVEEAGSAARRIGSSAYTRIAERATEFLTATKPGLAATSDRSGRLSASQVEALRLVLDAQISEERDRLGRFIPTLAVIGSASPLIGLLGTVLGVIDAFIGIGTRGSGNLAAVAPGIAEALIATAVALAVAIPAVFAYNIFASRLNRIEASLDGFGTELIALMAQEGRL